jgi:3'(2'), 5'-bisphosphate nucleotidase
MSGGLPGVEDSTQRIAANRRSTENYRCDTPHKLAVKRDQTGPHVTEVFRIPGDARLLDALTSLVSQAAAAILAISPAGLSVREKPDRSPVTAADLASETVIIEGLAKLLPGVPIVSEEAALRSPRGTSASEFLLVDPLDGTRELVAGRDEFTVNIALISHGQPRMGVIAAPARGLIWRGVADAGAERLMLAPGASPDAARETLAIRTRSLPSSGVVALVSRSHLDPKTESYLARIHPAERISCGSSLKFCQLAEGKADLYPRLALISEWDVAAGHAVLTAAGGAVTDPTGSPLAYGRSADFRIPGFIARGDRNLPSAL